MNMRPRFICMVGSSDVTNPVTAEHKFELHTEKKPTITMDTPEYAIRLWSSDPDIITIDKQHGLFLLLYGEIYNSTSDNHLSWITQEYIRNGLEFVKRLNGSFVLILIDSRKNYIAVVTDRVNSRRAYCRIYEGCHWISNCLYSLPLKGVNLDYSGIAWALLNKSVFHNRTLFDSVHILNRASIHEMKSDGLHRQQYWNYRFDNSYEGIKTERLKVELSELLVESIQRRTQDGAGIAISLSAGYDSTTILGVLRYILQMDSVQCFSFVRGNEPSKDGDAYRSHEMAKLAGYEHRMIQGYGGDLLKWIMLNGTMGNGIAGTNAEIDAMQELFQQSNNNHIRRVFMGDECFGCSPYKLKSHSDVFNVLDLRAGSEVPYLSELMDEGMCQRLGEGIAKDMEEIVANHNESYNLYDLEGYLHLDQYVSNYLLPNKEYFMGNFVFVENPFLDNAILDFMKKIPVSLRLDRRLYKDTVSEMFPQLFTIKRANSTEYYTDWEKEFLKYQKEIESSLLSQKSILDELIPPEKIIKFMRNGLSSKTLLMTRGWSKVKSNGYRVVNAFGKIIGSQRPPKINDTSHAEMLRRILVIRSFLNMTVDQNA